MFKPLTRQWLTFIEPVEREEPSVILTDAGRAEALRIQAAQSASANDINSIDSQAGGQNS